MNDDLIPGDVRQFIIDNIDSIAELEGLLLLSRNPEVVYSTAELAERLYTDRQLAADVLGHLYSMGFLATAGDDPIVYRYHPRSSELSAMVERVTEIYSKYLIPVTYLIHSKQQTKVQKFADAFKIRKRVDK